MQIDVGLPSVPDLVFPDTATGRAEAMRLIPDPKSAGSLTHMLCRDYVPYSPAYSNAWLHGNHRVCGKRDHRYMAGRNKCRRCPAGYMHEAMLGMLPDDEVSAIHREYREDMRRRDLEFEEALNAAV